MQWGCCHVLAQNWKEGGIAAFFAALLLAVLICLKWLFGTKAGIGTFCLLVAAFFGWKESKRAPPRAASGQTGSVAIDKSGAKVSFKGLPLSVLFLMVGCVLLLAAFIWPDSPK